MNIRSENHTLSISNLFELFFKNLAEVKSSEASEEIKQRLSIPFEGLLKDVSLSGIFRLMLRKYDSQHLEILLYGNVTDELSLTHLPVQYDFPPDEKIIKTFNTIEDNYHFFPKNNKVAQEKFITYFKCCKLIADFFEKNNSEANLVPALHAYKMLVLFQWNKKGNPFQHVDAFFNKFQCYKLANPIHDTLVRDLPKNNFLTKKAVYRLKEWRRFIQKFGMKGIGYFQQASEIEKVLQRVPNSWEEALKVKADIKYKRFQENPELAKLCIEYNIPESVFDKCLETEKRRKTSDNLPDVYIQVEEYPRYVLVKLPFDDLRAYILGHITLCCQSMGGVAEQCVIDGITLPNNGFYVLLERNTDSNPDNPAILNKKINYKDFKIVGATYSWRSWWDNFVLDSFEPLRIEYDDIVVKILEESAKQVTQHPNYPEIMRVTIGKGGKTPKAFKDKVTLVQDEKMRQGSPFGDANSQALVYLNQTKQEKIVTQLVSQCSINSLFWQTEQEFKEFICSDQLCSLKQVAWITADLLSPDSFQKWENLLGNDDDTPAIKQFLKQLLSSSLFEICDLLKKNNLFQRGNFISLMKKINESQDCSLINAQELLAKVQQSFDATKIQAINKHIEFLENSWNTRRINIIYDRLKVMDSENIFNKNVFDIFLFRHDVDDVIRVIAHLKRANLLNDELTCDLRTMSDEKVSRLSSDLAILHPSIINLETYKALRDYPDMRYSLNMLYDAGIFWDNYKYIIANPVYAKNLATGFADIHYNQLLNDENREVLLTCAESGSRAFFALLDLHDLGFLNNETRQALIKGLSVPEDFSRMRPHFFELKRCQLLTSETCVALYRTPQYASQLSIYLPKVKELGMLESVRQAFLDNPKFARQMYYGLKTLHEANIATKEENLTAIFADPENAMTIAHALVKKSLLENKLIENVKSLGHSPRLFQVNPNYTKQIKEGMRILTSEDILTAENLQAILDKPENAISIANDLLKKSVREKTLKELGYIEIQSADHSPRFQRIDSCENPEASSVIEETQPKLNNRF